MSGATPWTVGVVIPAQDEEATIARCIERVIAAGDTCRLGDRLWVVVVADSCGDGTVRLARAALAHRGEVIESAVRSPGAARRIGAAAVLEHFRQREPRRLWLANTDADTFVPDDWLQLHLELADEGATAVAGVVELDLDAGQCESLARFFRDTYFAAADGTHEHVHGANFGVRADAYLDVGGWSDKKLAEDHCLWARLRSAGWKLRATALSVVATSARLRGRASGGFADTLRSGWEAHRG